MPNSGYWKHNVSFEDAGYLLFGGKVDIKNEHTDKNESLELPYSYITGLSAANLHSSHCKCGYWPVIRASLYDHQVVSILLEESSREYVGGDRTRHEQDSTDPFQSLLREPRELNHEVLFQEKLDLHQLLKICTLYVGYVL